MLLVFDLDGTLFMAKPVVAQAGLDTFQVGYSENLRAAIRDCGALFPNVLKMLSRLHSAGHELIICSKSPIMYVEIVLEETGLAKFFTRAYSSGEYASKAECVREIIGADSCAVVIGDTHGDITAASENGLKSIAAVYGYGNKSMLQHADYFANTAEEIAQCVEALVTEQ